MNQTDTDAVSDELLDAELPCMGIHNRRIARTCSRAAALRSFGHGHGPRLKCIQCWQIWYTYMLRKINENGAVRCIDCGGIFITVESFSDYRSF